MYRDILAKFPIISDQIELGELEVILNRLEDMIDHKLPGDIVEFGCYVGTTSLFIQRLLKAKKSDKKFFVYDSFDGLPEKTKEDISPLGLGFKRGELRSTKAEFIHNFRKANLPLPIITKGWFHEVEDNRLPDKIAFAFLDGDYYKSIRASLAMVIPRMVPGGLILIDDYDNPALPGSEKAVIAEGLVNSMLGVVSSIGIVKL